jgi:ribosomal-protein-alanine N-acetyltransferase
MDIESKRLILKDVVMGDLENIHKLHSIPEVDEYNTLGIPKDIEETKEVIRPLIEDQKSENRKLYFWKIIIKANYEFIGIAGMNLSANKFKLGEIYYKLLPSYWGNGYATEVSKALIGCGFDEFHLHKIEAGVATENLRSIRVLEKSGMTREGLRRKILPIRGEWKDNYHYAIVEDDPRDY